MILAEPSKTPYDLSFSVLGLPIRVHPGFWILAGLLAILNLRSTDGLINLIYAICIVSAVFLGILVHELGHALTARRLGARNLRISLFAMGGLSVGAVGRTSRQRMMIIAAGPLAGILLAIPFFVLRIALVAAPQSLALNGLRMFAAWIIFVGFFWAVLNLLPIYPLDGGQLVHEFLTSRAGHRGQVLTLQISIVVAIVCAVLALTTRFVFAAFICAYLAFINYQRLRQMVNGL